MYRAPHASLQKTDFIVFSMRTDNRIMAISAINLRCAGANEEVD